MLPQVEEHAASRLEARLKPLETTLETLTGQLGRLTEQMFQYNTRQEKLELKVATAAPREWVEAELVTKLGCAAGEAIRGELAAQRDDAASRQQRWMETAAEMKAAIEAEADVRRAALQAAHDQVCFRSSHDAVPRASEREGASKLVNGMDLPGGQK
jgi:hypothetical protein